MKSAIVVLALFVAITLSPSVRAQEKAVPAGELYIGYSYLNADTNGLTNRLNVNGWETSWSENVNRWLGFEGNVSGYYRPDEYAYGLVGGPRFNFHPVFLHALIGIDTDGAFGLSSNGLAIALGGGVEQPVARHLAIRISADYVQTYQNIFGGPAVLQNNFRVGGGLVFLFGSRGGRASSLPVSAGSIAQATPTETTVIGASGYPSAAGFNITAVEGGSRAAGIFLNAGDVIEKVDGREVHTRRDIDTAIEMSASGIVQLDCLIRTSASGAVAVERTVKVR